MFRLLKYLLILAAIAVLALWGYSYVLQPEGPPPTEQIRIDVG